MAHVIGVLDVQHVLTEAIVRRDARECAVEDQQCLTQVIVSEAFMIEGSGEMTYKGQVVDVVIDSV